MLQLARPKSLDLVFIYVLIGFLLAVGMAGFFVGKTLDSAIKARTQEDVLNSANLLTTTVRQEMAVGNFRSAWKLITQNVRADHLLGVLITDDRGNLLVDDTQFQAELKAVVASGSFESVLDSEQHHLQVSHDGRYLLVRNKVPNLGVGRTFYEMSYLFFDNSALKIRKAMFIIFVLFLSSLIGMFVICFLFLRRKVFQGFRQIDVGVEDILLGREVSLASQTFFSEYFPAEKLIQKLRIDFANVKIKLEVQTRAETMEQITRQVAHDIRSPLSALNMVLGQLNDLPEQYRLIIRSSVNRINDIANTLLKKGKDGLATTQQQPQSQQEAPLLGTTSPPLRKELIPALIDALVSEKRVQFRELAGVEIESDFKDSYGAFANVDSVELKRALSNLVNNATEAFPHGAGQVTIGVRKYSNWVVVIVSDNGCGIPAHVLAKLGSKGITHGKQASKSGSGSGLGVYHAKKSVESFGGRFEIQSAEGVGTTISLLLPAASAPKWFVEKIVISASGSLISLDDDQAIHSIWARRLHTMSGPSQHIKHLTFTSGENFKHWYSKLNSSEPGNTTLQSSLFLVDYELLGQNMTGLDIIEDAGLSSRSILVTSHYEEKQIQNKCEDLGIRLIPKGLAGFVPFEIAAIP